MGVGGKCGGLIGGERAVAVWERGERSVVTDQIWQFSAGSSSGREGGRARRIATGGSV